MLHLSPQQEALYFAEITNSKWAENKWRDTNSRLTASWMALWINHLLFTRGDGGFHGIWREQLEIMVIRWPCRVAETMYEWVEFHLKRPRYKVGKYWCVMQISEEVWYPNWEQNQNKCQWDLRKRYFLNLNQETTKKIKNNYLCIHYTQFLFKKI